MLTLILIGFLGGLITGVSPCVLPMLPVIFFAGGTAKASQGAAATAVAAAPAPVAVGAGPGPLLDAAPLLDTEPRPPAKAPKRSRRPLKIISGLILSFSVFTLIGSFLLTAIGLPQDFLRWAGLTILSLIGVGLIFPRVEEIIQRPFYRLPKFSRGADGNAFVLGLGLGTLYVPCAGPVLAAITVAGATGKIDIRIVALTLAFAVGVAVPLFFFALAGDKIGKRLMAYRSRARKFRIAGGILMITLAVALAFNLTDALQRALPNYTQTLQDKVENSDTARGALTGLSNASNSELDQCPPGSDTLASCGKAPAFEGIDKWFNTPGGSALSVDGLKGKVTLVDFWTYSCINCQRSIPHVESWYKAYAASGLEVVGVHTPEFAFEKEAGNVQQGIKDQGVTYPVAMDNSYTTWTNYRNRYWPAEYLIDASGTVRHIKFGEGDYAQTENLIRELLTAANPGATLPAPVESAGEAVAVDAQTTPETYLAYTGSKNYIGDTKLTIGAATFTLPSSQPADTYGLQGPWKVGTQEITAQGAAEIQLNYQATKVYAVLGGSGQVTVKRDGAVLSTFQVSGTPHLYPIVDGADHEQATIELDVTPGIQAYTFTFG
ncbi:cytochrome c biogenesis protein DipZ [Nakamurella silvestris]|nr:cytochrome c biogenesis protein DipZ [Nakamurella silvestris]